MLPRLQVPQVSVLMPVRNGRPYVRIAIESVLGQSFRDFELIVLDDGSDDGTLLELNDIAQQDRRVCVVPLPRSGMRIAVNHGLELARAELIARMDADDICEPSRLEQQIAFLQKHPHVVALGAFAWAIDPDGDRLYPIDLPTKHEDMRSRLLNGSNCFIHPAVMYRKDGVVQVGGYQDDYPTDDYGLWLRLSEIGELANIPKYLLQYRVAAKESSIDKHRQQLAAAERILAEHYRSRGLGTPPTLPADYSPQSVPRIHHHWAMSAAKHRQWSASRKHSRAAIMQEPTNIHAWWTLTKAIFRFRGWRA